MLAAINCINIYLKKPKHFHTTTHTSGRMILDVRAKSILGLITGLMLIAFSLQCALAASQTSLSAANSASPRILGFNFYPQELILNNGSVQTVLQAHAADDKGDFSSLVAVFVSPSKNQTNAAIMDFANLISGDGKNGSYSVNLSFSSSSEAGNWTVDHLIACDGPGNCKRLNETAAKALGFPTSLVLKKSAQNENSSQDSSQNQPLLEADDDIPPAQNNSIYPDPNELRGWASTDKRFAAQRKIIINSVFNRPSICWT